MIEARPYRMKNTVMHYAWGAKNDDAFIPKLLGETALPDRPYAELWLGAHEKAPSLLQINDEWSPLNMLIQKYPESMIGLRVLSKFGASLPFLLKILSAGEPLSIQTHPNRKQAQMLHQKDPEHYPDANHKPEIAIALDRFSALAGFSPHPDLVQLLEAYPEIAGLIKPEILSGFLKYNNTVPEQSSNLKSLYQNLMETDPDKLSDAIERLASRLYKSSKKTEKDILFLDLFQKYGNKDTGLFILYFLNLVHLNPGEALFLKAGIPHAYLKGNIIECMVSSDNVVRAGLTPKFKDVLTLLDILTYEMQTIPLSGKSVRGSDKKYATSVDAFEVHCFHLKSDKAVQIFRNNGPAIMILTEGQICLQFDHNKSQTVHSGESFFIPAALPKYSCEGKAELSTVYFAAVP